MSVSDGVGNHMANGGGNGGNADFSRRVTRATAFIVTLVLLVCDYAFLLFGESHLPHFIYGLGVGVAWGLDPGTWISMFTGGGKK
jgi:hypothetical protein